MSTIDWPTPPQYPTPCPSCGRCPTCGRGGYHTAPWYPYWPIHRLPYYWYTTTGSTTVSNVGVTQ